MGRNIRSRIVRPTISYSCEKLKGLKAKKSDDDTVAPLSYGERIDQFVSSPQFALYCQKQNVQDGEVIQIAVPADLADAVTLVCDDSEEPIVVEGIKVIRSRDYQRKQFYVCDTPFWLAQEWQKRAKRLLFSRTYVVQGEQASLLLDNNDWQDENKVSRAFSVLWQHWDCTVPLGRQLLCKTVELTSGRLCSLAFSVSAGLEKRLICDINNGAVLLADVADIKAEKVVLLSGGSLWTSFVRLYIDSQKPLRLSCYAKKIIRR